MKKRISVLLVLAMLLSILQIVSSPAQLQAKSNKMKINKKKVTLYCDGSNSSSADDKKIEVLSIKNPAKKVKWTTSNKKVVTVKSTFGKKKQRCVIKAKKKGKATITAKVGKKKFKCKVVTVSKKSNQKSTVTLTVKPTTEPTVKPTTEPTVKPATEPTVKPTTEPTVKPTTEPTVKPIERVHEDITVSESFKVLKSFILENGIEEGTGNLTISYTQPYEVNFSYYTISSAKILYNSYENKFTFFNKYVVYREGIVSETTYFTMEIEENDLEKTIINYTYKYPKQRKNIQCNSVVKTGCIHPITNYFKWNCEDEE